MEELLKFTGKELLLHLEDKIYRVSEYIRGVIAHNHKLQEEIDTLKQSYQELDGRHQKLLSVLSTVREEKEQIAEKIKSILEVLDELEKRR